MKLSEELLWRGFHAETTIKDPAELDNRAGKKFYWGADPSADSLTIGNLAAAMMCACFVRHGYEPYLLVGGATGQIGDPKENGERDLKSLDEVEHNKKCIAAQMKRIIQSSDLTQVDNYDWFKDYNYLDFLRDVGKYVNVNYMLSKDIVDRRLDTGITYAEFSYMLIQGYDFLHMYDKFNCIMQVEGSDQWGNITTGIDLIRKIKGCEAYGFTMPLILDASGRKFGKSEGNALWLDEAKTSSYELYQYLINTDDTKVCEYLKVFTFLTLEEIDSLMTRHQEDPHLRLAQKKLAECIITDLHGKESYQNAVQLSEKLFSGDIKNFTAHDIEIAFKGLTPYMISEATSLVDLLVDASICSSKREAREFLGNGSISVNGERITDLDFQVTRDVAIDSKYIIIRRGKKKYHIILFS